MSGQDGGRGYLLQALISVLTALSEETDWSLLTLEPNAVSDKVDIALQHNGLTKAVQVKSSRNQIGVPELRRWAAELEETVAADEYELRVIGPISGGVTALQTSGRVRIPTPQPLNLEALVHQAAHKLDLYLHKRQLPGTSAATRELLVQALVTKLAAFSTQGTPIKRAAFDEIIQSWVLEGLQSTPLSSTSKASPGAALRQLPPPPPDFTGRTSELTAFRASLDQASCAVAGIRGMGGIGKSSFALKIASEIAQNYPDGQIYLDLKGTSTNPLTAYDAMLHVIQSFRPETPTTIPQGQRAALYRTILHEKRVLILLEDALTRDQLETLIPSAGSLLLFTSRQQFTMPGLLAHDLSLMHKKEAAAFLLRLAPRIESLAPKMAELCGYLPLALRLAASALSERRDLGPKYYVQRLTAAQVRLELVEASIELSNNLIDAEARKLFHQLAVFPGDFDLLAAASVWELNYEATYKAIGKLLLYSLVEWNEVSQRYNLHDLVRLYARKHIDSPEFSGIHTRLSRHYLKVCQVAEELYEKGGDFTLEGLALFDKERANIELGFAWAATCSAQDDEAAHTCNNYVRYSVFCRDLRQTPQERAQWTAAALKSAEHLKDMASMVGHTANLGRVFTNLGDIDNALLVHEKILDAARKNKDSHGETFALLQIGNAFMSKGEIQRAIPKYKECLEVARTHGIKKAEAHAPGLIHCLWKR